MKIKDIKDKEIRERAESYSVQAQTCSEYLNDAFYWSETVEGYDYWFRVNNGEQPTTEEVKKYKPTLEKVNELISEVMEELKAEFIQKNIDYNNSLHLPNLFGQDPREGLKARISDKFNRIISKGLDDKTEDSFKDLVGYYVQSCVMSKLGK